MAPPPEVRELSLLGHLEELRVRLIRCVVALIPALLLGYLCTPWVIAKLTVPFEEAAIMVQKREAHVIVSPDGSLRVQRDSTFPPADGKVDRIIFTDSESGAELMALGAKPSGIIYLDPTAPFMITIKTAVVLALFFMLPYILVEVWLFVSPGLYPHERRFAIPFLFSGVALFVIGAGFAYSTFAFALQFFYQFVQEGAYLYNDMAAYLSFVLYTMAAFGIVFELPLAIVLATQLGLVRREALAAQRRVVFVVLVFVAAVITPSQDPITLMIMAGPLYLLFEASLAVSKMLEAARSRRDAEVDGVGGVTR